MENSKVSSQSGVVKSPMLVILVIILVAVIIGVVKYGNNIENTDLSAGVRSSKITDSISPERRSGEEQGIHNLLEEKRYTPYPSVVVFSKDSTLDTRTKEDIRRQIKDQTDKAVNIPENDKKENSSNINKISAILPNIPSKLQIIEGQKPFAYINMNGSIINWFQILEKSYGTANGIDWNLESDNEPSNPLLARYAFPATFLNNKIYIASGWNGFADGCAGDVWHSTNGKGWLKDTGMAPWVTSGKVIDGRFEHTLTTHNSKMYLIGGVSCENSFLPGDVWSSTNGSQWNQLTTNNSVLEQRMGHATLSFKGKLFAIGGFTTSNGFINDVVSSVDGINWQVETPSAPWSPRGDHSVFVFNNKMWLVGGHYQGFPQYGLEVYMDTVDQMQISINGGPSILSTLEYYNDVWSSPDGINWTQETGENPFVGRRGHTTNVVGNTIYMVGGSDAPAHYLSDVITSNDGKKWNKVGDLADSRGVDRIQVAEHASVVTPANFGSTIPYYPPVLNYISYIHNGTSSIDFFSTIFSNDPQTTSSIEYKNYTSTWLSVLDLLYIKILGAGGNPPQVPVVSNLLTQNISVTNNAKIVAKISVKNSAGEKNFIQPYVTPCSPSSGPMVNLKPINNGNPLVAGQSYLVEWSTCNIPSTSNLLNIGAMPLVGSGSYQYLNLLNDGNEMVAIPSLLTPGTNYKYSISYYDPATNTGAVSFITIVIQ